MPPPGRLAGAKPDAIKLPVGYGGRGGAADRADRIGKEFCPLLGAERLFIRNQGQFTFASGSLSDGLCFPVGHDRQGEERYIWEERAPEGSGVFYGYLKPDDGEDADAGVGTGIAPA